MSATENTQHDPIHASWAEEPDVQRVRYWVKSEDGDLYQQTFVEVNGALFTVTDAAAVADQIINGTEEAEQ